MCRKNNCKTRRQNCILPKNLPPKNFGWVHLFYRQLDFPSEPGVAKEILENEAKSCLTVAYFYSFTRFSENKLFLIKSQIGGWAVAKQSLNFWPKSQAVFLRFL